MAARADGPLECGRPQQQSCCHQRAHQRQQRERRRTRGRVDKGVEDVGREAGKEGWRRGGEAAGTRLIDRHKLHGVRQLEVVDSGGLRQRAPLLRKAPLSVRVLNPRLHQLALRVVHLKGGEERLLVSDKGAGGSWELCSLQRGTGGA
eukprot:1177447-Prorocentrum_minimum.AAC.1